MRLLRLLAASACLFFSLQIATPASAQDADSPPDLEINGQIALAEVKGLIDPIVAGYLLDELDQAEANPDMFAFAIHLDSEGTVISAAQFNELATRLAESPLDIVVWVGPAGVAKAYGGAAELASLADVFGVAYGARVGNIDGDRLPPDLGPAFGELNSRLQEQLIDGEQAVELGLATGSDLTANSTVREFLTNVDGFVDSSEAANGLAFTQVVFSQPSMAEQLFHTAAGIDIAYLMFVGGIGLLIFELYTAGVGIAGVLGAFLFVMGSYGLATLPTRTWAIALLILSAFALAVDVQTNLPRLYTAVGIVLFVTGTIFLYDGYSLSWITLAVGIIGVALYAYSGMPSMVRTRFSTPTIGRSWMIGEMGVASTAVDPEGMVLIRDVPWRAYTNRATPLAQGDAVRVVGIDRMILEVEPDEGGARDYRERR